MKKYLTLLLAIVLSLSLFACGNKENKEESKPEEVSASEEVSVSEEASASEGNSDPEILDGSTDTDLELPEVNENDGFGKDDSLDDILDELDELAKEYDEIEAKNPNTNPDVPSGNNGEVNPTNPTPVVPNKPADIPVDPVVPRPNSGRYTEEQLKNMKDPSPYFTVEEQNKWREYHPYVDPETGAKREYLGKNENGFDTWRDPEGGTVSDDHMRWN